MAQALTALETGRETTLIGLQARVGGIGQEYEIVGIIDDTYAMIHAKKWDERVPYPIAEVQMDVAGMTGPARFASLIGQVRSIGSDGPKYEVVSVDDKGGAKIWIIPNDDNDDYVVEDILLDPFAD